MSKKRNAYILYINGKLERTLKRERRRWVDNIRMDFGEIGWGGLYWIGLAHDWNRWWFLVNNVIVHPVS
jgi:hypothetical protein